MILPRPMRKFHAASIAVLIAIAACLFTAPLIADASDRYDIERVGVPQIGARGVTRSTMDIMFEESMHNADSKGNPRLMNELEGPERAGLPVNPASPRAATRFRPPPTRRDATTRANAFSAKSWRATVACLRANPSTKTRRKKSSAIRKPPKHSRPTTKKPSSPTPKNGSVFDPHIDPLNQKGNLT